MSIKEPYFWEWAVFKNGELVGIKDDAPPEAKESYEQHLQELRQAEEGLVRI